MYQTEGVKQGDKIISDQADDSFSEDEFDVVDFKDDIDPGVSTIGRIKKLLGLEVDEDIDEDLDSFEEDDGGISSEDDGEDEWKIEIARLHAPFFGLMSQLESDIFGDADDEVDVDEDRAKKYFSLKSKMYGALPIPPDLDFTNGNSVDSAIDRVLNIMFADEKLEEIFSDSTDKESFFGEDGTINQDVVNKIRDFIGFRLLLNLTQPIPEFLKLQKLPISNAIKDFESESERSAKCVLPKEFADTIVQDKELPKELIKEVTQEENKVADNVYKATTANGLPVVVVTKMSEETIKAAISQLSHRPFISCYNLPKEFRPFAEREAILNGRPIYFSDERGKVIGRFSKYMPEQPGNWLEFYQNIKDGNTPREKARQGWISSGDKPGVKEFVEEIIGDNLEALKSFWEQAVDQELISEIKDLLSEEQKSLLDTSYKSELGDIAKPFQGYDLDEHESSRVRFSTEDQYRARVIGNYHESLVDSQLKEVDEEKDKYTDTDIAALD